MKNNILRITLLLAIPCYLLAGCANPIGRFTHSVGTVAQALVKHPIEIAKRSAEKTEEKGLQQKDK